MHLAWRWFTGLGFDQEIPHHSTFSKNRHGRFEESKAATRSRLNQYTCLCRCAEEEKKGGKVVRGTQEPDRPTSPAPAEIKVRSRAVLPGGGCAKYKKAGSLPQPKAKATVAGNDVVTS